VQPITAMKKALLLCFGLLLLAAAQLQAAPANVTFTSERGTPFNLRFDGRALTRGGARQVHINRITPGVHWVDFVIPAAYGRAINYRTRVFLDPGLETSYVLLTRPGFAPELRKVAAVPLRGGYGPGNGGYPSGPPRGGQGNDDVYYDDGEVHRPQSTDPNNGPYNGNGYFGSNNGGNYSNGRLQQGGNYPDGSVGYNRTMSPQDVEELVAAMHRQSFDKDRLPMARLALSETAIRSEDLVRLMKELSFEDSRMELAKYGAARVADRQNLYRLNDGFTFSASAREFQEYLGQQQR